MDGRCSGNGRRGKTGSKSSGVFVSAASAEPLVLCRRKVMSCWAMISNRNDAVANNETRHKVQPRTVYEQPGEGGTWVRLNVLNRGSAWEHGNQPVASKTCNNNGVIADGENKVHVNQPLTFFHAAAFPAAPFSQQISRKATTQGMLVSRTALASPVAVVVSSEDTERLSRGGWSSVVCTRLDNQDTATASQSLKRHPFQPVLDRAPKVGLTAIWPSCRA